MPIRLNLVVLRVSDLEQSATFYRSLGISFERHQYGSGLIHFSRENSDTTFELYQATNDLPVT